MIRHRFSVRCWRTGVSQWRGAYLSAATTNGGRLYEASIGAGWWRMTLTLIRPRVAWRCAVVFPPLAMPHRAARFRDEDGALAVGIAAADYRQLRETPDGPLAEQFAPPRELAAACATCGGTGFVRMETPVGHPDFGKAHTCPVCMGRLEAVRNG